MAHASCKNLHTIRRSIYLEELQYFQDVRGSADVSDQKRWKFPSSDGTTRVQPACYQKNYKQSDLTYLSSFHLNVVKK